MSRGQNTTTWKWAISPTPKTSNEAPKGNQKTINTLQQDRDPWPSKWRNTYSNAGPNHLLRPQTERNRTMPQVSNTPKREHPKRKTRSPETKPPNGATETKAAKRGRRRNARAGESRGKDFTEEGPVILATGGFGADFTEVMGGLGEGVPLGLDSCFFLMIILKNHMI